MNFTLDTDIFQLTTAEKETLSDDYCQQFRHLASELISQSENPQVIVLAYLLPLQRLLNSFGGALPPSDQKTFSSIMEKLCKLLTSEHTPADQYLSIGEELFRLATLTQHVTSWWYAADEHIENPETGEGQHISECISDCEKLFPNFQQRYDDHSLFIANCMGIALYDIAYLLLHSTDGHYYGYYQFLYHLCERFDNDAENRLADDARTDPNQEYFEDLVFLQNIQALKDDVAAALFAENDLRINDLLEKYREKTFHFCTLS